MVDVDGLRLPAAALAAPAAQHDSENDRNAYTDDDTNQPAYYEHAVDQQDRQIRAQPTSHHADSFTNWTNARSFVQMARERWVVTIAAAATPQWVARFGACLTRRA